MSSNNIYSSTTPISTQPTCDYGCGQTATFFKLPSAKVPNGRYSCKPSPNSCPAKRAKTKGDLNPSKRNDVRQKISNINSVLFASGSKLRKKCENTLIKKYGVRNPAQHPDIQKKYVATRRKNGSYSYRPEMNSDTANSKRKQTRIEKGMQTPDYLLSDWDLFEKEVDRLTEKTYNQYQEIINPNSLCRGRIKGTYQLDHIISKVDAFNMGLEPTLISNIYNLRMLPIEENISKGARSDMTVVQLLKLILSNNER